MKKLVNRHKLYDVSHNHYKFLSYGTFFDRKKAQNAEKILTFNFQYCNSLILLLLQTVVLKSKHITCTSYLSSERKIISGSQEGSTKGDQTTHHGT